MTVRKLCSSSLRLLMAGLLSLTIMIPQRISAEPVFQTVVDFGDNSSAAGAYNGPLLDGNDGRLYGLAFHGQVFSISSSGEDYKVLHKFPDTISLSHEPVGQLAMDSAGYLYGTTRKGGAFDKGLVFRMKRTGGEMTLLFEFDPLITGYRAPKGIMLGSDGLLYGAVMYGGTTAPNGGAFRINRDGTGFTELGGTPAGVPGVYGTSLPVEGPDGVLYGVAQGNGGGVYRMNRDGSGFALIHQFSNTAGSPRVPVEELLYASDGMLYGMFMEGLGSGSTAGTGGVFRILPTGMGFSVVKYFNTTGYATPSYGLAESPDGMLYGAFAAGGPQNGGGIFRMQKNGESFEVIHPMNLKIQDNTQRPLTRPLFARDRLVIGSGAAFSNTYVQLMTMNFDGSDHKIPFMSGAWGKYPTRPGIAARSAGGTLYVYNSFSPQGTEALSRIDPVTKAILPIRFFPGRNGTPPEPQIHPPTNGLTDGGDGWMYAATTGGGLSEKGAVIRMNAAGEWSLLYSFHRTGDTTPLQVIHGPADRLYGVTSIRSPSAGDNGSIFSLNRNGTGFVTLMRFTAISSQGNTPSSPLMLGSDGMLYGVCYYGGQSNNGVVYRISPEGRDFGVIHHFSGGVGGANPLYAVTEAPDGFLYGVTRAGGTRGGGVVYRLSKSGGAFSVLRSFLSTAGELQMAASPVLYMKDGYLCGLAARAVSRPYGGLFRIKPDGTGYQVVKRFLTEGDGLDPNSLIQGSDGVLYGTTALGGKYGAGTLYSYGELQEAEIRVHNGDSVAAPELSNGQSGAVDFGSTRVSVPAVRSLYIRNSGSALLSINSISLPAGYSTVSITALPLTLPPASGVAVQIRLDAAIEGTFPGSIVFESNDADDAQFSVPVSGLSVTPEIALLNADTGGTDILNNQVVPVDFGRNIQGTPGRRRLTLKNSGSAPLLVSRTVISPAYAIENLPERPFSLIPGGSLDFYFVLVSTAPGVQGGTVSILSDDLDEPAFNFNLTGEVYIPDPTITRLSSPGAILNRQTGLREQSIRLSNATSATVPACRLIVRGLPPGVDMNNASELKPDGSWIVYIPRAMQPHSTLDVLLEYYSATRAPLNDFPELSTEVVLDPVDLTLPGEEGLSVDRIVRQADGAMFLDFRSEPGRLYQVEYSTDGRSWQRSLPAVKAAANRTLWIDRGLPRTPAHPATEGSRLYRVRKLSP